VEETDGNETINRPRHRLGRRVAAALGLSLAIAAQAATAGADGAETLRNGFKGQTAEALFYSAAGCTGTEVFVHAVDGSRRGKPGDDRPDEGPWDRRHLQMDLELEWAGIGNPFKARMHIMLDYPGLPVNSRDSGPTPAIAI